jgi:hypothetical protein
VDARRGIGAGGAPGITDTRRAEASGGGGGYRDAGDTSSNPIFDDDSGEAPKTLLMEDLRVMLADSSVESISSASPKILLTDDLRPGCRTVET